VLLPALQEVDANLIQYNIGTLANGQLAKTGGLPTTIANDLSGGAAGEVVYQIGLNQTGFTAVGTSAQLLQSNGAGAPTWIGANDLAVTATGSTTARTLANRFADVVNVKDFGAVGDGVTDDTAAINSAISYLNINNGILFFPKGIYKVIGALSAITKSGCIILGSGRGATVISNASASGNTMTIQGTSITISDIEFSPTVARTGTYELAFNSASFSVCRNIYIQSASSFVYNGISIFNSSTMWLENINLRGITGLYGIYVGGSLGAGSYGCYMKGILCDIGSTASTTWIAFDSYAYSLTLVMAALLNGSIGISMIDSANTGSSYPQFFYAFDLECDHNNLAGASFSAGCGVYITNSWIGSCLTSNGVRFLSGFLGDANISNSRIVGNYQNGIIVIAGDGMKFTGNTVAINSQAGNGLFHGIVIAANLVNFTIQDNTTGYVAPFSSTSSKQGYGIIVLNGTSNYYLIQNNLGYGNYTGEVFDGGTGVNKSVTGNI
jgi:hypothetical protein